MKVAIRPSHNNLDDVMQIGDRTIALLPTVTNFNEVVRTEFRYIDELSLTVSQTSSNSKKNERFSCYYVKGRIC